MYLFHMIYATVYIFCYILTLFAACEASFYLQILDTEALLFLLSSLRVLLKKLADINSGLGFVAVVDGSANVTVSF